MPEQKRHKNQDNAEPTNLPLSFFACPNKRLRVKGCEVKSKRYTNSVGTEKVGKCWQGITLKSNPKNDEQEQFTDEIPF